jgi:D-alanyl-D-alanine carboxypeptidase
MRAAPLAVALAFSLVTALMRPAASPGLGREEPLHPGFSLSRTGLEGLIADLPEETRARIGARPRDFLDLLAGLLDGPQDLLALVDKGHGLSRTWAPADLVPLSRYPLSTSRPDLRLRASLIPDLLAMAGAAASAGAPLVISSAWRSYDYQEKLFQAGQHAQPREEVEKTLAPPGHSQHQLGSTIDFGSIDVSFARTAAGRWLAENAGAYGFSLSYPEGQEGLTGYSWEPWHYRYLGRNAARMIGEFFSGRQQEMLAFYAASAAAFGQKRKI